MDTNSAGWFSYVIVFGELAVGIGLILGAFVGLAAAGGLLMNLAFMLAGTTSTNPLLAIMTVKRSYFIPATFEHEPSRTTFKKIGRGHLRFRPLELAVQIILDQR